MPIFNNFREFRMIHDRWRISLRRLLVEKKMNTDIQRKAKIDRKSV